MFINQKPSGSRGGDCTKEAERTYFIGNCGVSGAFESLQFLLGPHQILKPGMQLNITSFFISCNNDVVLAASPANLRRLFAFDQTRYIKEGYHGMDRTGYVYIPRYCGRGFGGFSRTCYLHFYFHGCLSGR